MADTSQSSPQIHPSRASIQHPTSESTPTNLQDPSPSDPPTDNRHVDGVEADADADEEDPDAALLAQHLGFSSFGNKNATGGYQKKRPRGVPGGGASQDAPFRPEEQARYNPNPNAKGASGNANMAPLGERRGGGGVGGFAGGDGLPKRPETGVPRGEFGAGRGPAGASGQEDRDTGSPAAGGQEHTQSVSGRNGRGEPAYYRPSYVEDPWVKLRQRFQGAVKS